MSCYQIAFDVLSIDIEVIVMKSLYFGICIVVCVCVCVCVSRSVVSDYLPPHGL